MKKVLRVLLFTLLFIPMMVRADVKEYNIYLFYGKGCPHCKALEEFFDGYLDKHKNVTVKRYEVWNDQDNLNKLQEVIKITKSNESGIPFLVIGDSVIVGFDEDEAHITLFFDKAGSEYKIDMLLRKDKS